MSDWKNELGSFMQRKDAPEDTDKRTEMARFIEDTVQPAFAQLKEELTKYGRDVTIRAAETSAVLIVQSGGEEELSYSIQGRTFPNGVLPYAQIRFRQRKGLKYITVESMFRPGPQDYGLDDIGEEEIIRDFLDNYMRRVQSE